ncbi:MAG: capsule assembly Wzi family protein [Candidatus Cryptobacteroides sp.]|nr:capsule assembly Wzi family protein [Candidatus Cryptobacteroides sp.]MEE3429639.1 capsule assembly Wzi family protein [Candidatus Cryptobacteroides sp.]
MSVMKSIMALLVVVALPAGSAAHQRSDSGNGLSACWNVSMYGIAASEKSLPFWAVTNKGGLFPDARGGMIAGAADLRYGLGKGWTLYGGTTLAASLSQNAAVFASPAVEAYGSSSATHDAFYGKVGQLYAGIGWKALRLYLGMRDRTRWFEESMYCAKPWCSDVACALPGFRGASDRSNIAELSLTGGDMMWTGNARNAPGYNIYSEYIDVPWTKGILAFRFNYADYIFIDDRYVDKARLHDKSLYFRVRFSERVDFQMGLEHFAMWAGDSPKYGSQPHSFKDYMKVVLGRSGGSGATASDQANVLGDHRGRELFQLNWRAEKFTLLAAHDRPFEDGSGVRFKNFPDGVTTIGISLRDRDKWVTDVLYEYVFTRSQSGSVHARPATEEELRKKPDRLYRYLGGRDNYFNNGEYASGWTNYGRTMGLALMTPMPVGSDGVVLGIANNRIRAHHIGIAGKVARKVPYRLKATYSINYGNYTQRIEAFKSAPKQFSCAFEVNFPKFIKAFPCLVSAGAYIDKGSLYADNLGLTLRLTLAGHN